MSVKTNTTKASDINSTARAVDFVSTFAENWNKLLELLGTARQIEKVPGQALKIKKAKVTLATSPAEGDEIPYSQAVVEETAVVDPTLEKYAKGITEEAILEDGYDVAVQKTDKAFLNQLQKKIMKSFYSFLATGELTVTEQGWQNALAMAKGYAEDKFEELQLDASNLVAFVNRLDFYEYLGGATITVQNAFGMDYVQNFLGYPVVFLANTDLIARNTIIATPAENLVAYFINPATSDLAKAGFEFVIDGDTPLIGFHVDPNYNHGVSECHAIMGVYMLAEYIDGIVVCSVVGSSAAIGTCTATSAEGSASGKTKITVTSTAAGKGTHYFIKAASGTAPTAPDYLAVPDSTWTEFESEDELEITDAYKATVIECNGAYQTLRKSASITIDTKA